MADIQAEIVYEPAKGRSAAYVDGSLIGLCEYILEKDNCLITHTEVLPQFGGHGIARELVLKVAEEAKKTGMNVVPVCSYALKVLG